MNNDNNVYDLKKRKADLEAQLIKFGKLFDAPINKADLDSKLKEVKSKLNSIEKDLSGSSRELEASKETNMKGFESLEEKRNELRGNIIQLLLDER